MDKEIKDKHYRIAGQIHALDTLATNTECMPCDYTTAALLDVARKVINEAVASAWKYADKQTAEE